MSVVENPIARIDAPVYAGFFPDEIPSPAEELFLPLL
jgi:hypothetical protein